MSDECLEGSTRPCLSDMLIRTELLLEAPRAHSMYIIEQPYGKEEPPMDSAYGDGLVVNSRGSSMSWWFLAANPALKCTGACSTGATHTQGLCTQKQSQHYTASS